MSIKRLANPSGVLLEVIAASPELFARIAQQSGHLNVVEVQRLLENGQPVYSALDCYLEMNPLAEALVQG
jgi:hypothetical protein